MIMSKTLNPTSWFGTPEEKERAVARRITDEKEQAIALEEITLSTDILTNILMIRIWQHTTVKNIFE